MTTTTKEMLFVSWLKRYEFEENALGDYARAVAYARKRGCLKAVGFEGVEEHMIEHHNYTEQEIAGTQVWVTYASYRENPDRLPFARWVRRHVGRTDVKGSCTQFIRASARRGSLRAVSPQGVAQFVSRQLTVDICGYAGTPETRGYVKVALNQLVHEYGQYCIYGDPGATTDDDSQDSTE